MTLEFLEDELLVAAVRGGAAPWRREVDLQSFLRRCDFHGVAPLILDRGCPPDWPVECIDALRSRARAAAMWELSHQQNLSAVLADLWSAGVRPVLMKGTALAYSIYENPVVRTRGDTDLIIPREHKAVTDEVLTRLGFVRAMSIAGDFVSYQANYERLSIGGLGHSLDVHWRINNAEVLAGLFKHEELLAASIPLPRLSPYARGPSRIHSLLIACMHRSTHNHNPYYVGGIANYSADRLIWLKDIDLLATSLDDHEWQILVADAADRGLHAVCLDGLKAAESKFGTRCPPQVQHALSWRGEQEPANVYLRANGFRRAWMNCHALPDWSSRGAWLRENLLPPADYMRAKYRGNDLPLWWLYLRRASKGLVRRATGSDGI